MVFSFEDALALLAKAAARTHKKEQGQQRMREILQALGQPERRLRIIHVVGTSGKGSTTAFVAAILRASGASVGLTTSPHISSCRERIQINGLAVSEEMFAEAIDATWKAILASDNPSLPSYFQLVTASALYLFAKLGVDYAVVEAGVGGRGSATNVEAPCAAVILTRIGLDHVKTLGGTIQAIAREKAGIIPSNGLVFSAAQFSEAEGEIRLMAMQQKAELTVLTSASTAVFSMDESGMVVDVDFDTWNMSRVQLQALGLYQAENAALALCATRRILEQDGGVWNEAAARGALATLQLPGRFEIVHLSPKRQLIFDIAHNPQKMESLVVALRRLWPERRFSFVLGFGPEAEWRKMVEIVAPVASRVILTDFEECFEGCAYHFADPKRVFEAVKDIGVDVQMSIDDPKRLLEMVSEKGETVVITGYTQFVAAMRRRC